ncbi:MAG: hypothetical protein ACUVRC_04230 [Desulfotomaculales bacterium]
MRVVIMAAVVLVAVYTVSYGFWAWKQGNRRGAVGTFFLALAVAAAPVLVWWYHNFRLYR